MLLARAGLLSLVLAALLSPAQVHAQYRQPWLGQGVPAQQTTGHDQVLVAQRTLFQLSTEYLESLNEAWRGALQLQGFLAGDGLDAPVVASEAGETPSIGRRAER